MRKKWSTLERCPKCDSGFHRIQWIAGEYVSDGPMELDIEESLRVTCDRCGYVWFRAPLDATS